MRVIRKNGATTTGMTARSTIGFFLVRPSGLSSRCPSQLHGPFLPLSYPSVRPSSLCSSYYVFPSCLRYIPTVSTPPTRPFRLSHLFLRVFFFRLVSSHALTHVFSSPFFFPFSSSLLWRFLNGAPPFNTSSSISTHSPLVLR